MVKHWVPGNDRVWYRWNKDWWNYTATTTATITPIGAGTGWSTTMTAASNTTMSDRVWPSWVEAGSVRQIYSSDDLWRDWNVKFRYTARPVLTQAQRDRLLVEEAHRELRRRQMRDEQNARAEERRIQRVAAESRAAELLQACLTADEWSHYAEHGELTVMGSSGRVYAIQRGRAHNVFELDAQGRRIREFCGHVRDAVPDDDNVLAQKLLIECDEEEFRRLANVRELRAVA